MDIDVVITWVDGNNQEWRTQRADYINSTESLSADTRERRYRSWNNLQYLFRGIECHMPWVRKVYFVTPGHYPDWLRIDHPKLVCVNQNDLMPQGCTPTFNNCAVELCFHKLPGLAEHFVYFNDDMFPLQNLKPDDFFKRGLPCDTVGLSAIPASYSEEGKGVYGIAVCSTAIVAKRFTKAQVLARNGFKLYDPRNGKALLKTILLSPYRDLTGFNEGLHAPYSYLRSTYEEVWAQCADELMPTCLSRFRPDFGTCHWVMRYWQICKGDFKVRSSGFCRFFDLERQGDETPVEKCIEQSGAKVICINDNVKDDMDFEAMSTGINSEFAKHFPTTSSFER